MLDVVHYNQGQPNWTWGPGQASQVDCLCVFSNTKTISEALLQGLMQAEIPVP